LKKKTDKKISEDKVQSIATQKKKIV